MRTREDGRVKLYVHWCALHARRDHPGLFTTGEYHPLEVEGAKSDLVFAFARGNGPAQALAATPRLWTRLIPDPSQHGLVGPGSAPLTSGSDASESRENVWQDTRLILSGPNQLTRWRNVFTGESVVATRRDDKLSLACADVFAHFPIALLLNEL